MADDKNVKFCRKIFRRTRQNFILADPAKKKLINTLKLALKSTVTPRLHRAKSQKNAPKNQMRVTQWKIEKEN